MTSTFKGHSDQVRRGTREQAHCAAIGSRARRNGR